MNIDEIYAWHETLNGLALLKIAYDEGIPTDLFIDYKVYPDWGTNNMWDNFMDAVSYLFEIVEFYSPFDDECLDDKRYWIKDVGYQTVESFETLGVIVMMDDSLRSFSQRSWPDYYYGDFYPEKCANLRATDKGLVFIYDGDVGFVNWTILLKKVVSILKKVRRV